jgi:UDP:flavonoid glycosyltransferase YjiC (YdhE family)
MSAMNTCNFVITNGNYGTTCAGLLAGKPVLTVPILMEQYLLGRRVAESGAARLAEPHDLDLIVGNLRRLLHEHSHAAQARRFRDRYATEQLSVVDRLVGQIDQLLGTKA